MSAATIQEQAAATRAAELQRLHAAAMLAAAKACAKPILKFKMGTGSRAVDVVAEWPGVLRLFDATTGRPLAQSLPGQPFELAGWQTPTGWQTAAPEGGGKP